MTTFKLLNIGPSLNSFVFYLSLKSNLLNITDILYNNLLI